MSLQQSYHQNPENVQKLVQNVARSVSDGAPGSLSDIIPTALRYQPVWGVRLGKVPHQARAPRYCADSTNPEHWGYLDTAQQAVANGLADGLGSVMAADLGMVFIDLDHCFDDDGQLKPHAAEIVAAMPTHWHVSMSGGGLHGICYGQIPKAVKDSKAGIEMYASGRYIAWPTDVRLFGEVSEITDCSAAVSDLHARLRPPVATTERAASVVVSMDTRAVIKRLQATQKAARLLSGDTSGYPGYSEARLGLANKACFWTDDASTIADVLLASNLFKPEHNDRERERRSQHDANTALNTYTGERYNPNYGRHTPLTGHGAPVADGTDIPEDLAAAADYWRSRALKAEERIEVLIERVRRADAREEIYRNTNLGAPRSVAVVLAQMFHDEEPAKPGKEHCYRLPLARLARETGQSEDTCSRQLKQLATYRDSEGKPVFHVETVPIPRHANEDGVIIEPHKEIWGGPAVPRKEFANVMASLAPKEAPKHGGKPDRNGCPNHPNAGVIRRTKTTRKITHECAECHQILHTEIQPVGYDDVEIIPTVAPTQHDAFEQVASSNHPTQHDAACTSNHSSYKQPSMMPDRSTGTVNNDTDRPQSWTDRAKQSRRQQPTAPLVPRCSYHLGEKETCGEPTEAWMHEGYGNTQLCERHANRKRNSGAPPRRVEVPA